MESNLSRLCSVFPTSALNFRESRWLTKGCLERFLKACHDDVGMALTRLIAAINWRNANHIWDVLQPGTKNADVIRNEARSGYLYVMPTDKGGRAMVVYKAGVQLRGCPEDQLRLLVYTVERACLVSREKKIVVILDCSEVTLLNAPSMSLIKRAISILTNMYPERLATALVCNASLSVRLMITAVFNIVPGLVRGKLIFSNMEDRMKPLSTIDPVDWSSIPYQYQGRSVHIFNAKAYLDFDPPTVFPRSTFSFRIG